MPGHHCFSNGCHSFLQARVSEAERVARITADIAAAAAAAEAAGQPPPSFEEAQHAGLTQSGRVADDGDKTVGHQ